MNRDEDEHLAPREIVRADRRDRDISAPQRAGMRTGLAKGFKQILDAQAKRAREDAPPKAGHKRKRSRLRRLVSKKQNRST